MNFGWLQDKRTRQAAQRLPSILGLIATFLGLSNQLGFVIAIMLAVIVALVLWIIFNQVLVAGSKTKPTAAGSTVPPIIRSVVPSRSKPVTMFKKYRVKPGEHEYVQIDVKQGDRVKGHLDETSNQSFDWYIADEKNLVFFKKGDLGKFKPLDEGHDDPAYEVDKLIPTQARWYLILDMYGKKTDREVRVDFEEVKRS